MKDTNNEVEQVTVVDQWGCIVSVEFIFPNGERFNPEVVTSKS